MAESGLVGIVIVTYNRLERLKRCVENNIKQTYVNKRIYIVDNNSDDGTNGYCIETERNSCGFINYYRLDENMGGAYGFYYGIKSAVEDGCEFIWGMDDDAYPQNDALEILVERAEKHDIHRNGFWSNIVSHQGYKKDAVEEVEGWTFCGFFLSSLLVKEIGYPCHELFIFFDDAEYGQRITVGLRRKIFRINDSIVIHDGTLAKLSDEDFYWKKFLGVKSRKFSMRKLPNWKYYYLARNRILIHKKPGDKKEWWKGLTHSIKMLVKSLFIHPEYMPYIWRGIVDGILNKSGKEVSP